MDLHICHVEIYVPSRSPTNITLFPYHRVGKYHFVGFVFDDFHLLRICLYFTYTIFTKFDRLCIQTRGFYTKSHNTIGLLSLRIQNSLIHMVTKNEFEMIINVRLSIVHKAKTISRLILRLLLSGERKLSGNR
uniref:Uncharacterized protein n=1 Tax=Lepeophtheirus salmonis TaxID=72036 RepID=A0A0K2V2C9_LEPSM